MSNTIPLPEPLCRLMKFAGKKRNEVSNPCFTARECIAMADQVHTHAAAVTAAKDAEIAGLRAEVAALTENGPPMQRGTTIEGTPWMGTMREVLEDYKSAADTEARWGDEARAEVAGLREALAAAIRQNEHDMLMTGEELRAARAALRDKP